MEEIRVQGNTLKISAKNLRVLNELLTQAEKEAQQLHSTLRKLSCFELDLELIVDDGHAGEMEEASSVLKRMLW